MPEEFTYFSTPLCHPHHAHLELLHIMPVSASVDSHMSALGLARVMTRSAFLTLDTSSAEALLPDFSTVS